MDFAVSAKATLHPIWTTVVPNCFFGLKTCKGRFFTADDAMLLQLLREPRIVFQVHVFKAKRSNCRRLGCEDERRNTSTLRRISFVSRVIVTPGTLCVERSAHPGVGCGHFLPEECPDELTEAVVRM